MPNYPYEEPVILDYNKSNLEIDSDLAKNSEINERWKSNGFPVLGHGCPQLTNFQNNGGKHIDPTLGYCIPNIAYNGIVRAWDNQNPDKIKYCPFCGEKLGELQKCQS